ncbi:MAG: hypothetical protein CMC39_02680 [Flavobacteriaceae bacterium]|nr:hypothetical protein [Flavobacteriaceae bacterium]
MIIRVFKFTKLPQVIAAIIISILIMLAFKNIDNLVAEIYSLSLLVAIFFLSLFIISKNSILKNNQYISLGLIIFCGVYFKMPSEINITASYLFLLLSIRKIYSLKSKKNQNKKLFDIGFWYLISIILNPVNLFFIITILTGIFIFYKISPVVVLKIVAGMLGATLIALFYFDLTENIQLTQDYFIDIIDQIWIAYSANDTFLNQNLDHWLFASISLLIFLYYSFRFFGNNLGERIKNLFLITFFINSILLSFVINEYSIFLFFPFLVTLVKIISELKDNLFFETVVLIAIILNSYPYNFLTN